MDVADRKVFEDLKRTDRVERYDDGGERGPGMSVFTQIVRPIGLMPRAHDPSQRERDNAHWFVLNNCPEVEPHLQEHKKLVQDQRGGDVGQIQRKEFAEWFKQRMNQLRTLGSPEAFDEICQIADMPREKRAKRDRQIAAALRLAPVESTAEPSTQPPPAALEEALVQRTEEQSQPSVTTPMTEEQIAADVLGKRSGYVKGYGIYARTSSSSPQSRAPDPEVTALREQLAEQAARQAEQDRRQAEQDRRQAEQDRRTHALEALVQQLAAAAGIDPSSYFDITRGTTSAGDGTATRDHDATLWAFSSMGRDEEADLILRKIYPPHEVETEIQDLKNSVESEIREEGSSEKINLIKLLKTKTVRRGLIAGVGLQVFQQFVGINTVMYYSPTIVQLAGFASNQIALLLSLITSGLNAMGSIVSIYFIDRTGRKKLDKYFLY
ncbi:hypothetical protein AAC387_Pa01g1797 [Persea americana]